jgi:hypothetical protein
MNDKTIYYYCSTQTIWDMMQKKYSTTVCRFNQYQNITVGVRHNFIEAVGKLEWHEEYISAYKHLYPNPIIRLFQYIKHII